MKPDETQIQSTSTPRFRFMEPSGGAGAGEVATKRAKPSSDDPGGGEDRLSALPDDVLVLILLRLSTPAAARTTVLSRRWRRAWALIPELCFFGAPDPHRIGGVLEAHGAALRHLFVGTRGAAPDSVAAWLPAAARRVSGRLFFNNFEVRSGAEEEDGDDEEETAERGAFELPCLESATSASLHLGFLGLAVTPAGVFARLTELSLARVRLHGPGDLGDAVSSPRCPCLQKLTIRDARGVGNLAIRSDSLQQVELHDLRGLQQLTIAAPSLEALEVTNCFYSDQNQPVVSMSAPQLVTLVWMDLYDPSTVQLGEMEHLQMFSPFFYLVYGLEDSTHNHSCLSLLGRFKVIESLILPLAYMSNIDNYQYLMENMTMLPDITFLRLIVLANGHAFGASVFHALRMCSSIRRLILALPAPTDEEAQTTCPPGCICSEQHIWETEQLLLNRLQEVEITQLRGSEHEVAFVKQLFKWATALGKMTVSFDYSVTESMVKELCLVLRSFSRPEICMEFYMYHDMIRVLYAPQD